MPGVKPGHDEERARPRITVPWKSARVHGIRSLAHKTLIFGVIARGATFMRDIEETPHRRQRPHAVRPAHVARGRIEVWPLRYSSSISDVIKPQLFEPAAHRRLQERPRAKNGTIVEKVTLVALAPLAGRILGAAPQLVNSVFHSMTSSWSRNRHSASACCRYSFISKGSIWPDTRRGGLDLDRQILARTKASLLHQLLRRGLVILDLEVGLPQG